MTTSTDTSTGNGPVLPAAPRIEELGRELDAIRDRIMATRGDGDRRYILRVIRIQRSLALGSRVVILAGMVLYPGLGHAAAGWTQFLTVLALGTLMQALAKILENMEIAHNVSHAQWDWMREPGIQSSTWEWDHVCPSAQWRHSHNVGHHTWTNVIGMDRDVGYAMLRVTGRQKWHPFYLLQPISTVLMALYFDWFIAFHDLEINRLIAGRRTWAEARPLAVAIAAKSWRQLLKDYVLWPALAGPLFGWVIAANFVASTLRNVWTFAVIFCGHFPQGVHHFTREDVVGETRGRWYVRQLLGSCNIEGGALFHVLSGNLSHQIEHHLFPDMPSNRYREVAPQVRALAARYELPYNSGSFGRQLATTMAKLLRLSFPGGATV
jgi:NADPH-dependent stearoyl-CoA 9-desaturase